MIFQHFRRSDVAGHIVLSTLIYVVVLTAILVKIVAAFGYLQDFCAACCLELSQRSPLLLHACLAFVFWSPLSQIFLAGVVFWYRE